MGINGPTTFPQFICQFRSRGGAGRIRNTKRPPGARPFGGREMLRPQRGFQTLLSWKRNQCSKATQTRGRPTSPLPSRQPPGQPAGNGELSLGRRPGWKSQRRNRPDELDSVYAHYRESPSRTDPDPAWTAKYHVLDVKCTTADTVSGCKGIRFCTDVPLATITDEHLAGLHAALDAALRRPAGVQCAGYCPGKRYRPLVLPAMARDGDTRAGVGKALPAVPQTTPANRALSLELPTAKVKVAAVWKQHGTNQLLTSDQMRRA